jgi:CDP-glucose 4,6-dehydratase
VEELVTSPDFWQGKKVLITGHTGFKGSWLSLWLQSLGAEVTGIALEPKTQPNLFEAADVASQMTSVIGDICDLSMLQSVMKKTQPEIVFHLAAQALVRESYADPETTYRTNVMGTLNVLEAIRHSTHTKAAVMVTTDKCYDNKEWIWPYRETDRLGGHDPYSSSKACAELLINSYRHSYFYQEGMAVIASARAGNVIGGGDWASHRLIPDILQAKKLDRVLTIRYPDAIRPWQHVLEPLSGYLRLAEQLYSQDKSYADAWNFGPQQAGVKTVRWIADYFSTHWPSFHWHTETAPQPHEAGILKLDCSKAESQLGWQPRWSLEQSLEAILSWHDAFELQADMKQVCLSQIANYTQDGHVK